MPGDDDNPFKALEALRDKLPSKPIEPPSTTPPRPADAGAPARGPARAVVRLERKGRGGKEATVIEKLELPAAELDSWVKDMKRALGCGGAVEGEAIVLAGDQRDRAIALLEKRGVRRVIRG